MTCPFVLFLLAIVLSVLLRYMECNYPFDISKLFSIDNLKAKSPDCSSHDSPMQYNPLATSLREI